MIFASLISQLLKLLCGCHFNRLMVILRAIQQEDGFVHLNVIAQVDYAIHVLPTRSTL